MEQTIEERKTKPESIELNSEFTLFENTDNVEGITITETRSINRVGELLGEATKLEVANHPEIDHRVVNIQIEANTAKKEGGAKGQQTIEGEAGERLVMFAILPDGRIFGSFREISDQTVSRIIKFTQWYETENTDNKQKLINTAQQRKGSSLTISGGDLSKTMYIFK